MSAAPIDRFRRKQLWCYRGHDIATRRPLCHCGCGQVVRPPRRTAASQECVDRHRLVSDPGHIRSLVHKRDRGVCAGCGTDTVALSATIRETRALWYWLARREGEARLLRGELSDPDGKLCVAWGSAHGFADRQVTEQVRASGWHQFDHHMWEADHIVPVAEGGGGCGPEGYRTLCIPCHRAETAKLAARLAARRRPPIEPQLVLI